MRLVMMEGFNGRPGISDSNLSGDKKGDAIREMETSKKKKKGK